MPWLATHPDATEKVRIPEPDGPVFEFGFWPPLPEIEIRSRLPVLAKPDVDPEKDPDKFIEQSGTSWELFRDAVRWSVRGWEEAGALPAMTEKRVLDGRPFTVLSDESLDTLRRSGLLVAVGLRAIVFNMMTEEKKRLRAMQLVSSSRSQSTDAADASQASRPPPKDLPGETASDSGSKEPAPST